MHFEVELSVEVAGFVYSRYYSNMRTSVCPDIPTVSREERVARGDGSASVSVRNFYLRFDTVL